MKLIRIENSMLQENTYIIYENKTALIIDPGSDFDRMVQVLEENKLDDINIYLTHGHYDHIISVLPLVEKYNCPVYTYKDELDLLKKPQLNMSSNFNETMVLDDVIAVENKLDIFDSIINIYHVPGHTQGHSMLEVKKLNALFTGDFIFKNEIGRCDLPTGDINTMYKSLDKLALMDPSLLIYPGHGPSTTLKDEIRSNPYMNR